MSDAIENKKQNDAQEAPSESSGGLNASRTELYAGLNDLKNFAPDTLKTMEQFPNVSIFNNTGSDLQGNPDAPAKPTDDQARRDSGHESESRDGQSTDSSDKQRGSSKDIENGGNKDSNWTNDGNVDPNLGPNPKAIDDLPFDPNKKPTNDIKTSEPNMEELGKNPMNKADLGPTFEEDSRKNGEVFRQAQLQRQIEEMMKGDKFNPKDIPGFDEMAKQNGEKFRQAQMQRQIEEMMKGGKIDLKDIPGYDEMVKQNGERFRQAQRDAEIRRAFEPIKLEPIQPNPWNSPKVPNFPLPSMPPVNGNERKQF